MNNDDRIRETKDRLWPEWADLPTENYSEIPCVRCGGRCVEFTVPNDIWNSIVRRNSSERDDEYLCEGCYRKAVEDFMRVTKENITKLRDTIKTLEGEHMPNKYSKEDRCMIDVGAVGMKGMVLDLLDESELVKGMVKT